MKKPKLLKVLLILLSMIVAMSFCISVSAAKESEDNGTFARADKIVLGSLVKGDISTEGDEDFFKFTVSEIGKINIKEYYYRPGMYDGVDGITLYLYDGNRRVIYEQREDEVTKQSISVRPGTYYIRITQCGTYGDPIRYGLKIIFSKGKGTYRDVNNVSSFARAKRISLGKKVYGSISKSSECNYYKFTLPQAGVVDLTGARAQSGDNSNTWTTILYNARKEVIDTRWGDRVGLSAGTYYIKVIDDSHSNKKKYYIMVSYKKSNLWEKELNDTFDRSTPVRFGSYMYGMCNTWSDVDCYSFTVPRDGKVRFEFYIGDASYVTLYDSTYRQANGKLLCEMESIYEGGSIQKVSKTISLKKGRYYLKINHDYLNFGYISGTYRFRICTVTQPASIKLNKTSVMLTLPNTKTAQLKATVIGASKKVTWKSSNSRVASVSSTGKVTAKSAGKAVISATANGKTAKCTVTVKNVSSSSKKAQHKKYVSYIKAFHNKNFNAYMEWVYEGLIQPGDSDPVTYFAFMDIDGDGTDECMVRFCFQGGSMTTAPGGARSELYTIRSGKVKKVVEQGRYGSGSYPQIGVYRGSRLVEFVTSGHMDDRNEFFTFNNGALGRKAVYSYEWIAGYGTGNYYVNGTKTTKAKYNAFANKMKKGKRAYPMYRYTTANLNKFL